MNTKGELSEKAGIKLPILQKGSIKILGNHSWKMGHETFFSVNVAGK